MVSTHEPEQQPLLSDDQNAHVPGQIDDGLGLKEEVLSENVILRTVSVMTCFGSVGIYTASIGALIPLLENYYDIQDATVGWIFVMNVIGYLLGATSLEKIHMVAGRRGVGLVTSISHVTASAILATKPQYSIALVAYFLFGVGTGCADAGFCTWAANVRDVNAVQGLIHGSFSVGCVIGPLIIVALEKARLEWNVFYLVLLSALAIEMCGLTIAFRKDDGEVYQAMRSDKNKAEMSLLECRRPIIYCSLFYLCYVGIETSLSAWLVTFMSRTRDSSPAIAALSASMFWGGMALGRFTLASLARAVGLRWIVLDYILLSLIAQVLFRFNFHVATSLVLSAIIGFSFGPMFPAGVITLTVQLPKNLQVCGCSIAACVGQLGGAGAPFLLGLVAQRLGIGRLLDLVLAMSVILVFIWLGFSNTQKDTELSVSREED